MTSPMWRRRFSLVLAGLLVVAMSGCGSPEPEPKPKPKAPPLTDEEKAASLHKAARSADMDAVRCAIKGAHTPPDAGDRHGATALMMAADRGHEEVVRYMIAVGADVNHRESLFNTSALDLALWRERYEVAIVLLEAGADQREEALEVAVREGLPELARAAVEAGPLHESTVAELLADEDLSAEFRELLAQAETRPAPAPPRYTREQLEQFAGLFETWDTETEAGQEVRVTATDRGLRVEIGAAPAVELVASGEREFRSKDGEIEASFWGRPGSIETLTLRRGDAPPVRMRQGIGDDASVPASQDGAPVREVAIGT